jgi:hypothetical protein
MTLHHLANTNKKQHMISKIQYFYYDYDYNYFTSTTSVLISDREICLRGARDPTARTCQPSWETGEGLALYS